jgi:N-ethylmaleimide reductase
MNTPTLFHPLRIGALELPNRIVMPPMTRMRASIEGIPQPISAIYYAQRASAGLIIAEATAISASGRGYPQMPAIETTEQVAGWRRVTEAVHTAAGRIVLQIVHHGRWSHSLYNPDRALPVAPSAIAAPGAIYAPDFSQVPFEIPRALDNSELPQLVATFRKAARNALDAGFDAIEIHGANGFLLDQFLQDGSNHRTDAYGGTIAHRARLLLEVVDSVADEVGADRLGVRLSPYGNLGGLSDSDPIALFNHVIDKLSRREIAYLHLIEPRASSAGIADDASVDAANNVRLFRRLFTGPLITAGGYTPRSASDAITDGLADAVALGRAFIANPDLPERIRRGAALNVFDRSKSYGGEALGYIDYPTLDSIAEATADD